MQMGEGVEMGWPVGVSLPVVESIWNSVMLSEF